MLSKIERCVNLDIKVRIKIRKRDKGREKMGGEKENIGTYSLAISRKLESSKLDSTDPRGRDTTFFETSSSDLWIVQIAAQMRDLWVPIIDGRFGEIWIIFEADLRSNMATCSKVCAKTNTFHVCSAMYLHLDFGEVSILRSRNLARSKLSYLDIYMYIKWRSKKWKQI